MVWWNYLNYSSIGIRQSPTDHSQRILRFRPSKGQEISATLKSLTSDVILFIECGSKYRLGYIEMLENSPERANTIWLGEVTNEIMTEDPSIGAPFTGMLLGLYAFGELEGCLTPADFHYAAFR